MDNLDKVRKRQDSDAKKKGRTSDLAASQNAATSGKKRLSPAAIKKRKRKRRKRIIGNIIKIIILLVIAAIIFSFIWIATNIDFSFGDNLSSMNLNLSSSVYYLDEVGNPKRYEQFVAAENRIWVSIDKIPDNLADAFVAIEDQRFYKHHGVDLKRTTGAVLNYVLKGDSSYGGSTITQQLVKNITNDNERTKARKIREMIRSVILESKVSKEQILEMYMNTIYLGEGANGVESAANVYFSKDVSELSLAECACIAGITQYPSTFDPLINPDKNEAKRKVVLKKMLELGYIDDNEYQEAVDEKLKFKVGGEKERRVQSYFLDNLFEQLLDDLKDKGYSEQFATNLIYNGGLKIYSTVDPDVQSAMEDYYEKSSNFPTLSGSKQPQSAMVIMDPQTGEVKGVIGGRGEKDGNRVLNRATQTMRQPGSSIKPLSVYSPAVDLGIITPATTIEDSKLEIGDWAPTNSDKKYHGYVSARKALNHSYNIPAVRILEEVTVDKSFDYLTEKLHIDTIVSKVEKGGKVYSDKNLSSLALGGLTNGVTVMDMTAAYASLANKGVYIEPHVYTKVYDADGRVLIEKKPKTNRAFSEETAFIICDMLSTVVQNGTGYGAAISNMDTCGKTGTTDDDHDRWFIGYTPYYVGAVWFGYDTQKSIAYYGTNPSLTIWKNIMTQIHKPLPAKHFKQPSGVEKMTVCTNSGKKPTYSCSRATDYVNIKFAKSECSGKHEYIGTKSKHSYSGQSSYSTKKPTTSNKTDDESTSTTESGQPPTGTGNDDGSQKGDSNEGIIKLPPADNSNTATSAQ